MKDDEKITIAELKAKKSQIEAKMHELKGRLRSKMLDMEIIEEEISSLQSPNEEANNNLMNMQKILQKQQFQLMCIQKQYGQIQKTLLQQQEAQKQHQNQLQEANISHKLDLHFKQIKDIDLNQLPNLKQLNLSKNQLKGINLSSNTLLQKIYLKNNHIQILDLSANKDIVELNLGTNQLSFIELTNNTHLSSLNLDGNRLRSIDLTKNIKLVLLCISMNSLVNLDLTNNIHLNYLFLDNNKLKSIDLENNSKLKILYLANNSLANIDLQGKKYLQKLDLSGNRLTNINLTSNLHLKSLQLSNNCLTNINLKKNISLRILKIYQNNLKMIILTNNAQLKDVHLNQNQLQRVALLYNSQLYLCIQNQYVSKCKLTMLCHKEQQYDCRQMVKSLEGVSEQDFDIRLLTYQGNQQLQKLKLKLEQIYALYNKQIQKQHERELTPQSEKMVNNLKILKQHLNQDRNYRRLINQMVSNIINYESFIPNDNINVYTLLQNQKRNINILKKYDLEKQAIVQKQIQHHFTMITYKEQRGKLQNAIDNYWKELKEFIKKPNKSNVKQQKRSNFQLILDYIFQDKSINQIQNQMIYRALFAMSIRQKFKSTIIDINIKNYDQQKRYIKNSPSIYQSLITQQLIKENDQKVKDFINLNEQTLQIAKKLEFNHDLVSNLQGLYEVQEIDKSQLSQLMIHFKPMNIHRTAVFAQFKPEQGRQWLFRLLLPKINKDATKSKAENDKQQRILFSQNDAQNVIKIFIKRIKMGFLNATKKEIKVSLILLRHLILDLNFNNQNYPNPLPYLNILQAFIDVNNPKSKDQNFVGQFYLNGKIKSLNLDYYKHNKFICAIFLLSLINKKGQRQFLNDVYQFLHEKSSRNPKPEKIKQKQTLSQALCNHFIKANKNHRRFYIDNVQSFDMNGIIIRLIRQEVRDNLDDFEQAEALFREIIQQQEPQRDFISIKSSYVIGINGINQPLKYYYKMVYKMNNVQNATQQQRRAATDLFNITYSNYIYLWQKFRNIVPGQIIKPIRPVLYVLLIQQRCMQPNQHFMVLFPFQGSQCLILNRKQRSYYQDYMDQPSIQNMLIKDKSEYFRNLPISAQNRFIKNLFKIAEEFERLQIEPIVLNLAEIAFIQQDQNIFQHEESIVPAIEHLTFFKVVKYNHIVANNQAFTRIFEHLPLNHEIFTQNCSLNVWNNQYYSKIFNGDQTSIIHTKRYHIGSLGFALCLLLFRQQQQERRGLQIIQFDYFQRDYISRIRSEGNKRVLDVDQLQRLLRDYTHDEVKIQFLKNVIHPDVHLRMRLQEIQVEIAILWP